MLGIALHLIPRKITSADELDDRQFELVNPVAKEGE
jgi:hypothetical protein